MTMKYEDILTTVYPGAFQAGEFSMAYDAEGNFSLTSWAVPGVPQPTNPEILVLETPAVEHEFACNQFFAIFVPVLTSYFTTVAKQKTFNDELSCISYYNSTNTAWQNNSRAFSAWRDACWAYVLTQQQLILAGGRAIPGTTDGLITELPVIVWP